jgi:hypothetical protein
MGYQYDKTIVDGYSKSIYGFRSEGGVSMAPKPGSSVCDTKITLYNPFDFTVQYHSKTVKVRQSYVTIRRRQKVIRWHWVKVTVPYPRYIFKKQTHTVRAWREIHVAGQHAINQAPDKTMLGELSKRLAWLRSALARYPDCRAKVPPRSAESQHNCKAIESTMSEFPTSPVVSWVEPITGRELTHWTQYMLLGNTYYRFLQVPGCDYTGKVGTTGSFGVKMAPFKEQLKEGLFNAPSRFLNDSKTIETVAALLWPSSDDMEKIAVTPLVDIAEMISDGTYPLGPPPDPRDAHAKMVKSAISDTALKKLMVGKHAIDFAANLWLWETLVLAPVVSSAIGLAASVSANDKAIERYNEIAKKGEWVKGKKFRLYNHPNICSDGNIQLSERETYPAVPSIDVENTLSVDVEINTFEGNAQFVYKLDESDAVLMNTSGAQIASYLQRLSVDLYEVAYNLIPLSFVFDWFSTAYSGKLNLRSKTYLPIGSSKLILSQKCKADIILDESTTVNIIKHDLYAYGSFFRTVYSWNNPRKNFRESPYSSYYYVYKGMETKKVQQLVSEHIDYYERVVIDNPTRRTNFDFSDGTGLGLSCLDTNNHQPLQLGQEITGAALIWGLLT